MIIRYGCDDPFGVKHTADWVPIAAGQRIMYDYGGGGGWGDPLDRDPQAVLDDVLDEYVSVEGATRDYGVVLTGSLDDLTLAVDDDGDASSCGAERREHGRRRAELTGLPRRRRRRRHVHRPHLRHPGGDVVLDKTPTTLDDQSTGVMNGLGQLAERFGVACTEFCAELDIVVHGTTTADNTMIEMNGARHGPARHRGPPRRDRDAPRPQGDDLGPVVPGPARRSRAGGPASRSRERMDFDGNVMLALDEDAVRAGVRRLQAARRAVDRGDVPVLVREPRARAARRARSCSRSSPTSSTSRCRTR